ncbi:hypothetical protein ACFQU2_02865 [Siccirubricoccus deserti]
MKKSRSAAVRTRGTGRRLEATSGTPVRSMMKLFSACGSSETSAFIAACSSGSRARISASERPATSASTCRAASA